MTGHSGAVAMAWHGWRVEREMVGIAREYGLVEPMVDMAMQVLSAEELLELVGSMPTADEVETLWESFEKSKRVDGVR